MDVVLPPGPGYSATFVRGLRSAGQTNEVEESGAVIVKRSYVIAGGTLVPDAAGDELVLADCLDVRDDVPWVTYESELAVAKHHGDVIVLGGRDPERGAWVTVDDVEHLRRSASSDDPEGRADEDLEDNLFGWHPRSQRDRRRDARMVTDTPDRPPTTSAGDRYDRFHNAQRRHGGSVTTSRQAALPERASIEVKRSRIGAETEDQTLVSVSYDLPPLALTLYVHRGRGPDRATRWCPEARPPLVLDTLVLRPVPAQAHALWRGSWRWGEPGADALRRAVVTEGGP